jgi:hypothetical protein
MQTHIKTYSVACSLSLSVAYTSFHPLTHTAILSPANLLSPICPSTHQLDYPLTQWSFSLLHTSSLIAEEHMHTKLLFSSVLHVNILQDVACGLWSENVCYSADLLTSQVTVCVAEHNWWLLVFFHVNEWFFKWILNHIHLYFRNYLWNQDCHSCHPHWKRHKKCSYWI